MKITTLILTFALSGLSFLTTPLCAQHSWQAENDSIQSANAKATLVQAQKEDDAAKMADAKDAHRKTKAKAKETRRVNRDATIAAKEAKYALRAEKKAQKSRKDADRQSRKAVQAKDISDDNNNR
jgi:hypothetical protein